jgi:hypothetical protein
VLAMDPRQCLALTLLLDLLEGDSTLGMHTLPEYTTGVAGKAYPTPTGSPWPPAEAPCLSCTSIWNAWWDASETTSSQERARRRVKDTAY